MAAVKPAGNIEQADMRTMLTLSGGGIRATLFELGILNYLALAGEFPSIAGVVSVSGGSILAAHMALNWDRAQQSTEEFEAVAAQLVRFLRSDIRNSAGARWLWRRIFTRWWKRTKHDRTHYLRQHYEKLFGAATLGDIPAPGPKMPLFALLATDTFRSYRVAFTQVGILQFSYEDGSVLEQIPSTGMSLSLAVTVSSCFPGAFETQPVNYEALGLKFNEFHGEFNLLDGGLADNSGIEAANAMMVQGTVQATHLIACDAETGVSVKPSSCIAKLFAALSAPGTVVSANAKKLVTDRGDHGALIPLDYRVKTGKLRIDFLAETEVGKFRTDLDQPSWPECYALMRHGAAVCATVLGDRVARRPSDRVVRKSIREIIVTADGPKRLHRPTQDQLRGCSTNRFRTLIWHGVGAVALLMALLGSVLGALLFGATEAVCYFLYPQWRPTVIVSEWLTPTPITPRVFSEVVALVANGSFQHKLDAVSQTLTSEPLTEMMVRVEPPSSASLIYAEGVSRPQGSNQDIRVKFRLHGQFPQDRVVVGSDVVVVGHFTRISPSAYGLGGYVDMHGCYIKND